MRLVLFLSSMVISFSICFLLFVPVSVKKEMISLDVSPGKTFYTVAGELKEKKIIRSQFQMKLLIFLFKKPCSEEKESMNSLLTCLYGEMF